MCDLINASHVEANNYYFISEMFLGLMMIIHNLLVRVKIDIVLVLSSGVENLLFAIDSIIMLFSVIQQLPFHDYIL